MADERTPKILRLEAGAVKSPATGRFAAGLGLAGIVFALDQASKYWILEVQKFSGEGCLENTNAFACRKIELSGIFDLTMVWNRGVSFGMLQAGQDWARWALVGLSLVISAVFIGWLRSAERRLTLWALGLVIGGALGNVVDRIRFGAVADFLDFSGLYFPWVFNVADAGISVGAALLFLDFLTHGDGQQRK